MSKSYVICGLLKTPTKPKINYIVLYTIIIIISAYCSPLLNLSLPNIPAWPVRRHLHPTTPRSFDDLVGPSGRWPSHAALSHIGASLPSTGHISRHRGLLRNWMENPKKNFPTPQWNPNNVGQQSRLATTNPTKKFELFYSLLYE